ncbi:MAG: hypothetical protein ACI81I_001030 [Arcobacteraceae bacterium]|jgi:hypothetical protein
MGLSSNSIIHFTNKKEYLQGILENNFQLSYCKEEFHYKDKCVPFYVPMVSFCDIPLSEMKNHIDSYGSYGIGLSKEWANRHKLNPVLYISKNSSLSNSYDTIFKKYIMDAAKTMSTLDDNEKSLVDILRYMKLYQNKLVRANGETIDNYRFSDEREWRYVLDYNKGVKFLIGANNFNKDSDNKMLLGHTLDFEPNDIKYIIVEQETEIQEFISFLKDKKGNKFPYHDIERLTTRIITVDQIKNDF